MPHPYKVSCCSPTAGASKQSKRYNLIKQSDLDYFNVTINKLMCRIADLEFRIEAVENASVDDACAITPAVDDILLAESQDCRCFPANDCSSC